MEKSQENKNILVTGISKGLGFEICKLLLSNSYNVYGLGRNSNSELEKFDNFKFRYNVIKTLRFLNKRKINIFIVTNQAGIAKGYYTKKDFYKLHIKIKDYLIKKNI